MGRLAGRSAAGATWRSGGSRTNWAPTDGGADQLGGQMLRGTAGSWPIGSWHSRLRHAPRPADTPRRRPWAAAMVLGAPRTRSTAFYRTTIERGDFTVAFEPFSHVAVFGQAEISGRSLATAPEVLGRAALARRHQAGLHQGHHGSASPRGPRRPAIFLARRRPAHLPYPAPAGDHPLQPAVWCNPRAAGDYWCEGRRTRCTPRSGGLPARLWSWWTPVTW